MTPCASRARSLDCERKHGIQVRLSLMPEKRMSPPGTTTEKKQTNKQTNKLVIGSSIQVYEELSRFWHIPGTIQLCTDPASCLSLHKGEFPCDRGVIDNSNNPLPFYIPCYFFTQTCQLYLLRADTMVMRLCLDAPESLD